MMTLLTCITGFFMNFELLPILTDYANLKKGGWNLNKIFSSESTEPISTKLCWNDPWVVGPLSRLCPSAPSFIQDGRHY